MCLHRCQIFYGNVLIHDFIPCCRLSDMEAGVLDIIEYNNATTDKARAACFISNEASSKYSFMVENYQYTD